MSGRETTEIPKRVYKVEFTYSYGEWRGTIGLYNMWTEGREQPAFTLVRSEPRGNLFTYRRSFRGYSLRKVKKDLRKEIEQLQKNSEVKRRAELNGAVLYGEPETWKPEDLTFLR